MTEPRRDFASRMASTLRACLAALIGFLAFNVIDGVFGVAPAILALAAGVATTVVVFRHSPPRAEDADA